MSKIDDIMKDISDMPENKKEFLIELMTKAQNIHSKEELMRLFLTLKKESAEKQIQLSNEELAYVISVIKKNASEAEKGKIDKIYPNTDN